MVGMLCTEVVKVIASEGTRSSIITADTCVNREINIHTLILPRQHLIRHDILAKVPRVLNGTLTLEYIVSVKGHTAGQNASIEDDIGDNLHKRQYCEYEFINRPKVVPF